MNNKPVAQVVEIEDGFVALSCATAEDLDLAISVNRQNHKLPLSDRLHVSPAYEHILVFDHTVDFHTVESHFETHFKYPK